jgi:hypothetical protein
MSFTEIRVQQAHKLSIVLLPSVPDCEGFPESALLGKLAETAREFRRSPTHPRILPYTRRRSHFRVSIIFRDNLHQAAEIVSFSLPPFPTLAAENPSSHLNRSFLASSAQASFVQPRNCHLGKRVPQVEELLLHVE